MPTTIVTVLNSADQFERDKLSGWLAGSRSLIHDEDDARMDSRPSQKRPLLSEGAAADSACRMIAAKRLEGLPRILRYALLVRNEFASDTALRLLAEIDAICPDLAQATTWALVVDEDTGLPLADELDRSCRGP